MTIWSDFKHGARSLMRTPGSTLLAVLILGVGIGANSAMFSVINTLVLKPIAVPEPEEIQLVLRHETERRNYNSVSYPDYLDLRDGLQSFEHLAAHSLAMVGIGEGRDTRRGFVDIVSANYFDMFGVVPEHGRWFTAEEEAPGALQPVAVLGYRAWQRLGGEPDLIGERIVVNGLPMTVVGVTPESFSGTSSLLAPELYMPLGMFSRLSNSLAGTATRSLLERDNGQLLLLGRLRDGVGVEQAEADLIRVSSALEAEYPATNEAVVFEPHPPSRVSVSTSPQQDDELAVLSLLLLAMSMIVLLVAGFNLAALQDARNLRRRRELGVRLALGAGRLRLVRQLVCEAFALALAGAVVGLLIGVSAPRLLAGSLAAIAPFDIFLDGRVDWRIVTATVGFAFAGALVVGLLPALRAARSDVVSDLKQGRETAAGRRRFAWTRGDLPVLGQLALSMVLLVSAGLFVKSAVAGANVDPGFDVERQALMEIDPSLAGYDEARSREVQDRLRTRLLQVPGVRTTALAGSAPFGMTSYGASVLDADAPAPADGERRGQGAALYTVSDDYFATMGIPLLSGREFRATEAVPVAIVDAKLARDLFGTEDAVGRRIALDNSNRLAESAEVVGVVRGIRDSLFDREPQAHIYLPSARGTIFNTQVHVALDRAPDAAVLSALRSATREVDASLPVLSLMGFADALEQSFEVWALRTGGQLFATFAVIALLLAVAGVYGVQAYRVTQRRRELGLRMALGATARETMAVVLRDGIRIGLWGLGLGLLLAWAVGRLLQSILVEVGGSDPAVFGAAMFALSGATLVACLLPALRASRLDPLIALREEA